MGVGSVDQSILVRIEAQYASGITSAALLDVLASLGVKFSESALRKWVQLGLLPRSVRVGSKGKHSGSHGLYPACIVRQILEVKELLAQGMTIDQLQSDIMFMRGGLQDLQRSLDHVFSSLEKAIDNVQSPQLYDSLLLELSQAKILAKQLMNQLQNAENLIVRKYSILQESQRIKNIAG